MSEGTIGGLFDTEATNTNRDVSDVDIVALTQEYRRTAEAAKRDRDEATKQNVLLYNGKQDWSHKLKGQSTECLPMLSIAVEQITTFVKRAVVDYGDWFSVETPENAIMTGDHIRDVILSQLNSMRELTGTPGNFQVILADAVKTGILHSLIILKVYGAYKYRPQFTIEKDEEVLDAAGTEVVIPSYKVTRNVKKEWHLRIDVVNPLDYFPDPTGRKLYEIHRTRKDLHEIKALAEGDNPIYDKAVVAQLEADCEEQYRRAVDAALANQTPIPAPDFRKEIVLDEVWGSIVDRQGNLVAENMVWVVANEKYLIRPPEPNPWWHGESPFVVSPLLRVPFSVWHRALADLAAPLNISANELFSLMLDGAFEAVHGVKQVRLDYVERPEDLAGGITPGMTIPVKAELPPGVHVVERVDESAIPGDALSMLAILDRHFQTAMQVNEIRLGMLPSKEVRATEVVQAEQNLASFFDGIIRDLETVLIEPLLYKSWAVIVQEMNDLPLRYIKHQSTREALTQLAGFQAEERYAILMNDIYFCVRGLSGTLQRAKDFQKLMALMTSISRQPLLLQAFFEQYSASKVLKMFLKWLNIDPLSIEMDEAEREQRALRLQEMERLAGLQGSGTPSRMETGGADMDSEINQTSNPLTGLVGGEG